MNPSDFIASLALSASIFSVGYTIYSNKKNIELTIKNDKISFLKSLSKLIRSVVFSDVEDKKSNILDSIRDELNFNSYFDDKNKSFQEFSEALDDDTYVLIESICKSEFDSLKVNLLEQIINFKERI